MKEILDYEFMDHGFQYEDYWNGCGKGSFDYVYTGCGISGYEAFQDLLEQLAIFDINVKRFEKKYLKTKKQSKSRYYYISIRFNLLNLGIEKLNKRLKTNEAG